MPFYRFDGTVINAVGQAIPDSVVYVCTQPANTASIPPSPLATIYSDSTGTVLANPVVVDGNGNFFFYAVAGIYTLVYFDTFGRITKRVFLDQNVVAPGGGTVTSVALTVPTGFAVTGSPVTAAGTLALAYSTDWNANVVLAGPTGGAAAAPTRRPLVAADLPDATTSVKGAVKLANDLGGTAALPTVVKTTLTLPLPVNQGGRGSLDAKGNVSGAITADGSTNSVFTMTLTGNVTSTTFSNGVTGQIYTFVIKQDGVGSRTFAWPAIAKGASAVGPEAGLTTTQSFVYDGSFLIATGPGLTMA